MAGSRDQFHQISVLAQRGHLPRPPQVQDSYDQHPPAAGKEGILSPDFFFLDIKKNLPFQVVINVPVFKDERTPTGRLETFSDPESQEASKEGHIYMDAMGFGMGLSCLQVTFQATDMSEAETLYDQLAPLCPIFLALTASSPIFRGWLSDVDCRWDIISASVDCRTKGESGEGPLAQGEKRIPKSRYASISSYLSDCALQHDLNDVDLVHDPKIFEQLKRSGVKELMAKHISHLFIR